jgi:SOS-response transcriptional repressor LexA
MCIILLGMYITKIKIKLNNITKSYQFNPKKQIAQTFIKDADLDTVRPNTCFFLEVGEDSLIGVGINPKDLALVDNSLEPINNDLILAFINGIYSIRRLVVDEYDRIKLTCENENYEDIDIEDGMDFEICGVIVYVLQNI